MNENTKTTKIITVTLNPSLDRTLVTQYLHIGYHNSTSEPTRLDAAGAGLNISRAIHKLEGNTHAVVLVGNDATGKAYQVLLEDEEFPITTISVDGQTRSNTIILDTGAEQETQITENADNILRQDVHLVLDILKHSLTPGDTLVLAGSLPNGLSEDVYGWLTEEAHKLDATVVLAASSTPLEKALDARPDLVIIRKPELESFFNIPVRDHQDVVNSARKLEELGVGQVFVSMPDEAKALVVSEDKETQVTLTDAHIGTTSGVWEAMIAGFLVGQHHYKKLADTMELSAAAALFAASKVGHEFGEQKDVEVFMEEIQIDETDTTQEEE